MSEAVQTIGRYELHAQLASGGMATVYLGRLIGAAGFSKCVAIKRLHPHLAEDPHFFSAIVEEARLAERVKHPNVASTIDVVAEEDGLLLVMEYIHGQTLAHLLRAAGQKNAECPPEIVARIIHDTLLGLHAAHNSVDAAGAALCIVHRDVSPQNIVVGADGVTRLLDFGVAKAYGSIGHTKEGHLKGKVPYMAPEVLRYEPPSPLSDIWAAAVVFWETRCGRRLFRGENEIQVWGSVLEGEIPDPATLATVPSLIDTVILRGLKRDVALRYPTALAMADDIERCVRLASSSEVAAWVQECAGEELAEREKLLRSVENAPPSGAQPTMAVSEAEAARPRRRPIVYGTLLVVAAAGALMAGFATQRMLVRGDARAGSMAAPADSTSATTTTDDGGATAAAAPPVQREESADAATARGVATSGPRVVRRPLPLGPRVAPPARSSVSEPAPAPVSTAPKPDCDPPYFVDESGHKRFRLECVTGR